VLSLQVGLIDGSVENPANKVCKMLNQATYFRESRLK